MSEEEISSIKMKIVQPGSLLFAKIGEAIRLNRRALTSSLSGIDNNVMSFRIDLLIPKFIYYWSKSIDLYPYSASTTTPSIRKTTLEQIKIPLPPLDEQKRIVEFIEVNFAKLDEAAAKLEAFVESSNMRAQGFYRKAVSGELTKQWRAHHKVTASWSVSTLGDVGS